MWDAQIHLQALLGMGLKAAAGVWASSGATGGHAAWATGTLDIAHNERLRPAA